VRGEHPGDLDLPFSEQDSVDQGVRIELEDGLENAPPSMGRRMSDRLAITLNPEVRRLRKLVTEALLGDRIIVADTLAAFPIPLPILPSAEEIVRGDAVALGQARDDDLALLARQLAIGEIAGDAADVRHPVEFLEEI